MAGEGKDLRHVAPMADLLQSSTLWGTISTSSWARQRRRNLAGRWNKRGAHIGTERDVTEGSQGNKRTLTRREESTSRAPAHVHLGRRRRHATRHTPPAGSTGPSGSIIGARDTRRVWKSVGIDDRWRAWGLGITRSTSPIDEDAPTGEAGETLAIHRSKWRVGQKRAAIPEEERPTTDSPARLRSGVMANESSSDPRSIANAAM